MKKRIACIVFCGINTLIPVALAAPPDSQASSESFPSAVYTQIPDDQHGVIDAFWPNGKLQTREYYCNGQPVGFHRYFDKKGRLTKVADFTKTDYTVIRVQRGKHRLVSKQGGQVSSQPVNLWSKSLFMEAYDLSAGKPQRIRFMTYREGSRKWEVLDPETTVATWTREGDQGDIVWQNARWKLINSALDYSPFWEHYQRNRQQQAGIDPPDPETEKLLHCPWIDASMSLAKENKAFAFPALPLISDAERVRSPRAKYVACMQQADVNCLLHEGLERAKREETRYRRDDDLQSGAVVALAVGQAQQAITAMDITLHDTEGFGSRNSFFALPAAIKAMAAKATGQQALADESAQLAFEHGTVSRPGYEQRYPGYEQRHTTRALLEIARPLARLGYTDLAQRAYEQVRGGHPAQADEILLEIGLAHLQARRSEQTTAIITELRTGPTQPAQKRTDPMSPDRVPNKNASIIALTLSAQGALEGGHQEQATAIIERIEAMLPHKEQWPVTQSLLAMYARAGMAAQAKKYLLTFLYGGIDETLKAAALLCDAGQAEAGLNLLRSPPENIRSFYQDNQDANLLSGVAAVLMRCGEKEEAQQKFALASTLAEKISSRQLDVIGNFSGMAKKKIIGDILDIGEIDLVEKLGLMSSASPEQQLRWALKQAERRNTKQASSVLSRVREGDKFRGQPNIIYRMRVVDAELLLQQGDKAGANAKWREAVDIARTISRAENRGDAFEYLARLKAGKGDQASALLLLEEALIDYDRVLADQRQSGNIMGQAMRGFGKLAADFARLGQFERAQEVAESLLNVPGAFLQRSQARALADQLEIRVLLSEADAETWPLTSQKLASYPPSLPKLLALDELKQRKAAGTENAAQAAVAQVIKAADYLDRATTDAERRQMIGIFASWLRQSKDAADTRQGLAKLVELSARVVQPAWRAPTLCDLGYTARQLAPELKEALFAEGVSLAEELARRGQENPPPSATGACAYWRAQAGDHEEAIRLRDLPMASMRAQALQTKGFERGRYSGNLLDFALMRYTSEQGDLTIDWPARLWR